MGVDISEAIDWKYTHRDGCIIAQGNRSDAGIYTDHEKAGRAEDYRTTILLCCGKVA